MWLQTKWLDEVNHAAKCIFHLNDMWLASSLPSPSPHPPPRPGPLLRDVKYYCSRLRITPREKRIQITYIFIIFIYDWAQYLGTRPGRGAWNNRAQSFPKGFSRLVPLDDKKFIVMIEWLLLSSCLGSKDYYRFQLRVASVDCRSTRPTSPPPRPRWRCVPDDGSLVRLWWWSSNLFIGIARFALISRTFSSWAISQINSFSLLLYASLFSGVQLR